MSKIIENFLVPLFLVISVLYAFHSFANDTIVLNKVYHHQAQDESLEKANISLYFSGDPQMQEINKKKAHETSTTFFFPNAMISQGECEAMVNKINNYGGNYKVTMAYRQKPTRGIVIQFDCDPHKYLISCKQFDSIGLQKGFTFRLYNKELLTKLEQANNQPVLRTLHNTNTSPRVIIDSGHGGRDTGAIGYNGIQEKEVCLSIGITVGDLLEKNGCSVMLTRKKDVDMQLDERTSFAHNNNADLFVSIHANYASNNKAIGIETFCMQPNLLKKTSFFLTDKQYACIDSVMAQRAHMSYTLAQSVQRAVCDSISPFHDQTIDRKVKYAISQVLLGVQMPAILIEVGFLSHPKEALLLQNTDYQHCIAHGICNGILRVLSF